MTRSCSSTARPGITRLCCDAHAPSRLPSGRLERGTEADTAVKRGYLNLIHARESIAEQAKLAIERAEDASPVRRIQRRGV